MSPIDVDVWRRDRLAEGVRVMLDDACERPSYGTVMRELRQDAADTLWWVHWDGILKDQLHPASDLIAVDTRSLA